MEEEEHPPENFRAARHRYPFCVGGVVCNFDEVVEELLVCPVCSRTEDAEEALHPQHLRPTREIETVSFGRPGTAIVKL